ncbi:MAG: radical SAM protein [Firmicutes bacterium]|nr:radical SAM protein [Bacillota bacterium]
MSYFRFFPDCYYLSGPVQGVIYNLSHKYILPLTKMETEIVNRWKANESIEEVESHFGTDSKVLLNHLIKEGLGAIFTNPVLAEPLLLKANMEIKGLIEDPPQVKLVYLQLNENCNANCKFCGSDSYYKWQGCNSCLRWTKPIKSESLPQLDYNEILQQLNDLKAPRLIFSGGNPLLEWLRVYELILFALKLNPKITVQINTNGFGLNDTIINEAKTANTIFSFTVFGNTPEDYKKITGLPEVFNCLIEGIKLCQLHQVPYLICLLIDPEKRSKYTEWQRFAMDLGGQHFFTTELIPKLKPSFPILSLPTNQERLEQLDINSFFSRQRFNPCLNGVIAVSDSGIILPCPMFEIPLNEIPGDNIFSVFRKRNYEIFWRYTKQNVPICQTCGYRLVCSDCSILEWALQKNPTIHKVFCDYEPQIGKWRQKEPEDQTFKEVAASLSHTD